ncbi:ABC transporter permease [Cohnella cellulosilytica]|uniref:ABC transporter permease n=1 Tax=Cohnella cellulosilytica TaxID=986710 RepID=A0ABW2FDL2_9BACL
MRQDKVLYLLLLVPLLHIFVFRYLPIFGLSIAFKDFNIIDGIFGSKWVGFKWFQNLFASGNFEQLLRNSLLLSFATLLFTFPAPIVLAISFNELGGKLFKRFAQTVSYLPYFISPVVVVGLMSELLSPNSGVVNALLGKLGIDPIFFMSEAGWFRTLYVSSEVWQTTGFMAIIYMAAISGIAPDLYEAADMDGAGRLRKIWHVTLPGIAPTIVILLLMKLGNFMDVGFEKVLLMYSPATYETADIFDTFVYRRGLGGMDYSFATATGLFKSLIAFVLVVTANRISRKVTSSGLW